MFNLRRGLELPEVIFDFGMDVVSTVVREMRLAEKYIRIAIFQLHNEDVFRTLEDKRKQGLKIEIITLPYDSINEDIRPEVEPRFRELENCGALIRFNKWNVGDPSRTTTAVGRWYSFHGKFIVTDKSAVALSANFTQEPELDAAIIFRGSEHKIKEFNEKFEHLLDLFVNKDDGFDGSVHEKITSVVGAVGHDIFELPKNIDAKHKDHWIRHYPVELCPSDVAIQEGLYLTPFDCRGRDFIENLIEDASDYVYISTESFTDEDFSNFLVNESVNKNITVKILSGTKSMDFTDRVGSMFRDLLAQEIDVRTTDEDIHAKLVITDKALAVSSINLNKINLGFQQTSKYWRENTESILVCKNPEIIRFAKDKYLEIFNRSHNVKDTLSGKIEDTVKEMLKKTFQLRATPDVRVLFAKFVLKKQIDVRKLIIKIGKITKRLMNYYGRTKVEKQDFISALILYFLSEGKRDYNQLKEQIDEVEKDVNLLTMINALKSAKLVEQEGDYYKINIEKLVS